MRRILAGTEKGLVEATSGETLLSGSVGAAAVGSEGWWAVVDGYRILASPDGDAWDEAGTMRGLRATCVLPVEGGALVGTSEAHLVAVASSSATRVRSFDRVPTRDEWYTPWGGPADVRSLSGDAGGGAYANVHVGGILRSEDGVAWQATSMDIDADVHQVLAHPADPGVAFAATAVGLATTRDAGGSWEFTEEGLHAAYCRAVAVAGDTLLLSASTSHTGRHAALYRRALAGGTFERCARGLPEWFDDNLDTYCIDADGGTAAIGTSDGLVFASDDAGRTWSEVASGLPAISCVLLA